MARGIVESGDAEALIYGHPEGPLVVGISSDGEYKLRGFLEFPDEGGKFVFAENGVDGGKDETAAREHGTECGKAVHAAGGASRNEAKRHAAAVKSVALQVFKMTGHTGSLTVAYHNNLVGIVMHKNPDKAIYHHLAVDGYQRLRICYPFCCQTRTLAGSYNSIFHPVIIKFCAKLHIINDNGMNLGDFFYFVISSEVSTFPLPATFMSK